MSILELNAEAQHLAYDGVVEWRIEDSLRRIFVKMRGQLNGRQACIDICRIFLTRPDAVAYDMLYDMRDYEGDVEPDDVELIVAVYAGCKPDSSIPCRTAFATPDKNFALWAAAMDQQFLGRAHRTFPHVSEAASWLDQPIADRKA
jgi:hypothetical protein